MEQKVEDKLNWIKEEIEKKVIWSPNHQIIGSLISELTNICWIQKEQVSELTKKVYGE